ncbi:MAG TPA: HAMP domain-containing sensor histidine kinase [Methylomirabilota bacterium]|nr:HAMP domain-containing sensor histidine kinase [Methylomirabilota bacterium]
MLDDFLATNRAELISRCRDKVAKRPAPRPTDRELRYGIPLFLDQLVETLRRELTLGPPEAGHASFAPPAPPATPRESDIGRSAAQHGHELLHGGFTIDQVVHDYGDLCQAVTELAVEQNAPVTADEFRILNRCLDDAIADAVTEFGRQRDQFLADEATRVMNERLGSFAHELRNLVHTAILSATAIKKGTVGFAGATGAVHERSLIGLRDLIDRTLVEVRLTAGLPERRERLSIAEFLEDIQVGASLDAAARGMELVVSLPPEPQRLVIEVDRQILAGAVANLLQNAFKFSRALGRVSLRAHSAADRVLIEIEDECGGLPPGKADAMFRPFEQLDAERTGLGLGLAISQRGVEANGGKLTVRDLPGTGCVFIVTLPRSSPQPL